MPKISILTQNLWFLSLHGSSTTKLLLICQELLASIRKRTRLRGGPHEYGWAKKIQLPFLALSICNLPPVRLAADDGEIGHGGDASPPRPFQRFFSSSSEKRARDRVALRRDRTNNVVLYSVVAIEFQFRCGRLRTWSVNMRRLEGKDVASDTSTPIRWSTLQCYVM